MFFTVIFGFLTLVGFSLFITILLSSILKVKSKKIIKRKELFDELAYRTALEGRYKTEVEQESRKVAIGTMSEASSEMKGKIPSIREIPASESKGFGAFFLGIILGAVILVFGLTMGGRIFHTIKSRPKVYFSESVNYLKMKPEKASNRFIRGNVNVLVKLPENLTTDKLLFEIYRVGEDGLSKYKEVLIQRKPDKVVYVFKTLFDRTGTYLVYLRDYTTRRIFKKSAIQIVPDEYAYKPVIKK